MNRIPPVVRSVQVNIEPQAAFDLFTGAMRLWWPFVGHSCGDADALDVHFEPCIGGAVTEIGKDGRRWHWGTLAEWDPPRGFAMSWHPGLDEALATRLRVRFLARDGGTEVQVHHDGFEARGEQAAAKRDQYDGGWPATLAAFAARAAELQHERTR